jgi:hypothetical protein
MTDIQLNKSNTYGVLKMVFAAFLAAYERLDDFKAILARFTANIDLIQALHQIQILDNKGITINKNTIAANLKSNMTTVRDAVVAHAVFTKDKKLENKVDFKASELNGWEKVLISNAAILYGIAHPLRAQLTELMITEADIEAVNTNRLLFLGVMYEPRFATGQKKAATQSIRRVFREMDSILRNELDPAMRIFKTAHPDFFDQYTNGRIIVDLGGRKTKNSTTVIEGFLRHFETLDLLAGGRATVVETGQTVVVGADAKFHFTVPAGGVYSLRFELDGFQTYLEDSISIETGQIITLDIELEPLES